MMHPIDQFDMRFHIKQIVIAQETPNRNLYDLLCVHLHFMGASFYYKMVSLA